MITQTLLTINSASDLVYTHIQHHPWMAENSYIIAGLQFLNEVKGVLLGNRPDQIKLKKGASGVKALQHICKSDYA